jgi:hypothetical protein
VKVASQTDVHPALFAGQVFRTETEEEEEEEEEEENRKTHVVFSY